VNKEDRERKNEADERVSPGGVVDLRDQATVGQGHHVPHARLTSRLTQNTLRRPWKNNYNPKCRLYLYSDYRLEIQSVMLVVSTGFVNYCLSNLLSS
jgi:hypothetical protein